MTTKIWTNIKIDTQQQQQNPKHFITSKVLTLISFYLNIGFFIKAYNKIKKIRILQQTTNAKIQTNMRLKTQQCQQDAVLQYIPIIYLCISSFISFP